MKNLSIFILMLGLSTGAIAQDASTPAKNSNNSSMNNGFIGIFGGYAISTGNWTHTAYNADEYGAWLPNNSDNLSSGFAGNGSTFGVEGGWFFCNYIGIGGSVSHSS